jgi:hypothetical protein
MVTIFDMVTGEIIADDSHDAGETRRPQHAEASLIAPRLQTVEEASSTEQQPGMPADLADADIGAFLGRH